MKKKRFLVGFSFQEEACIGCWVLPCFSLAMPRSGEDHRRCGAILSWRLILFLTRDRASDVRINFSHFFLEKNLSQVSNGLLMSDACQPFITKANNVALTSVDCTSAYPASRLSIPCRMLNIISFWVWPWLLSTGSINNSTKKVHVRTAF